MPTRPGTCGAPPTRRCSPPSPDPRTRWSSTARTETPRAPGRPGGDPAARLRYRGGANTPWAAARRPMDGPNPWERSHERRDGCGAGLAEACGEHGTPGALDHG